MDDLINRLRSGVETALVLLMSAMVVLTFTDVIGRRLFGKPVFGAHDITEHLMALMVFAGLPLVTLAGNHLKVDLFDTWLLAPSLRWWRRAVHLICAAVMGVMAWTLTLKSVDAARFVEVSQGLNVPRMPVYAFMALCALLSALATLLLATREPAQAAHQTEDVL